MHRQVRYGLSSRGFVVAALLSMLLAGFLSVTAQNASAQDESISGEYGVTLVRVDIPTDLADGYSFVGRWIVTFAEDGTYSAVRQDIGQTVAGSFEVSGDRVTIQDEGGIMSCANPTAVTISTDDVSTGTYEWSKEGDELTLVPVEDGCKGRILLLSTRPLEPYVPCETEPLATPEAEPGDGTPTAVDPEPVADESDPLAEILTPDDPADQETSEGDPIEGDPAQIAGEIDGLLAQMTACWATGDADLWLPLLSTGFREALIGGDPDFAVTIQAAMSTPIVWERSGDVELTSETEASAIVRTTVAQEQDFQRFAFVIEDGEWRWDG